MCFQRDHGEAIPGCTGNGNGGDWDYCYDPDPQPTTFARLSLESFNFDSSTLAVNPFNSNVWVQPSSASHLLEAEYFIAKGQSSSDSFLAKILAEFQYTVDMNDLADNHRRRTATQEVGGCTFIRLPGKHIGPSSDPNSVVLDTKYNIYGEDECAQHCNNHDACVGFSWQHNGGNQCVLVEKDGGKHTLSSTYNSQLCFRKSSGLHIETLSSATLFEMGFHVFMENPLSTSTVDFEVTGGELLAQYMSASTRPETFRILTQVLTVKD